ncbi:MAG: hypothetical protein Q9228_007558 [Teloschistes exilis]
MAQNSNQIRQAGNFPSPHSYPSPSMSAYAYPSQSHGHNTEPYRASPTGSNISLPSLNLPPIRTTMDGRPQSQQGQQVTPHHSQQQPGGQAQIGAPLPPPPMSSYYPTMAGQSLPPPQHMNVTSDPNQPLRYPLPPPDGRMMSGGRHKKEIKRRTKTGCLTCRKRRIKCDEVHPACRNCQKSKRECLGYDPIFKSQPGPAAIQPAPSAAPPMQPIPTSAPPYPPPPQGYVAAASQSYTPPNLLTTTSSPNATSEQQYDYGAALDPALASSLQSKVLPDVFNGMDANRQSASGSPYPPNTASRNSSGSHPFLSPSIDSLSLAEITMPDLFHAAERSRLDELIAVNGIPPPLSAAISALPPSTLENIKIAYQRIYGPAIDKLVETQWFVSRGMTHVMEDARLCGSFATLIARYEIDERNPGYPQLQAATKALEASVIWSIMGLARRVAGTLNPINGHAGLDEDTKAGVLKAARRVEIVQNLLLGQHVDAEVAPQAEHVKNGTAFEAQLIQREREFWQLMYKFLTIRDDEASASHELDATLKNAIDLLDSRENRDVIYSIAVVRLRGGRENLANHNNGEESSEDDNGLGLAKTFLKQEAHTKGTNQVVQRVCGMAVNALGLSK